MDIERLKKARRLLGKMNPLDGSDWADALDIAERAIDEAIARQSVTSEEVQDAIGLLSGKPYGTHNLSCDCVFCKALDLAITSLKQYQGWIPVSERLPEKRLYVLTYRKNGNSKVLRFENDCKWYDSYNEWETDVTHWKPLPEPPNQMRKEKTVC